MHKILILLTLLVPGLVGLCAQNRLLLGVDLSTADQIRDGNGCGWTGYGPGNKQNIYQIFEWEGADIVRLRVYVNTDVSGTSDKAALVRTCNDLQLYGIDKVMIDFHYSNSWSDPGVQYMPSQWHTGYDAAVGNQWAWLGQKIYDHTVDVLTDVQATGVEIVYVQVGNETNNGFCQRNPIDMVGKGWNDVNDNWHFNRMRALIKRGCQAVAATVPTAKVAIHAGLAKYAQEWYDMMMADDQSWTLNPSDIDAIALSYYPTFQKNEEDLSIAQLGVIMQNLRIATGKEVLIAETAFPKTWSWAPDGVPNNINAAEITGYPISPWGQFRWYNDLSNAVANAGGSAVFSFEPGWLPCADIRTATYTKVSATADGSTEDIFQSVGSQTGSSFENCSFFNFSGVVEYGKGGFLWLNTNNERYSGWGGYGYYNGVTRNIAANKSITTSGANGTKPTGEAPLASWSVQAFADAEGIRVTSSTPISRVEVFDLTGRRLYGVAGNGTMNLSLAGDKHRTGILLVRTHTESGIRTTKVPIR